MTIGVFDSGRGGHYVAERLKQLLPEHEYMVVDDHTHVPYGSRSQREITRLTERAIAPLLEKTPVIVIACNTATAAAIDYLREKYPDHQFVGFEPMLKPLAETTRHGIVLATPATLHSARYLLLKEAYTRSVRIDEPATELWAHLIERGQQSTIDFSELDTFVARGGNVISLSCTHYLALKDTLTKRYKKKATVIEPTEAVAHELERVIYSLPD